MDNLPLKFCSSAILIISSLSSASLSPDLNKYLPSGTPDINWFDVQCLLCGERGAEPVSAESQGCYTEDVNYPAQLLCNAVCCMSLAVTRGSHKNARVYLVQ